MSFRWRWGWCDPSADPCNNAGLSVFLLHRCFVKSYSDLCSNEHRLPHVLATATMGAFAPGQFNALYCQLHGVVGFMKRHLHEGPLLRQPTLLEIFSHIKDHRRAEGKLYPLPQILVFCLLAMLAGATSYRKMHEFIMAHFRRLSVLFPSRMLKAPCYAQIRNILAGLDPADMEEAFRLHAQGLSGAGADGLKLLAIDGKSLRGSFDALKGKKATQILSVFATGGRIILAHVEMDDKTNEIPVAQALIAALHLEGCLFTFDALHCQKQTFQAAAAVGSRVLVQGKDNQPSLAAALDNLPAAIAPEATSASSEKGRNRQKYRHVQVFHADGALDVPEWDEY